MLDGCKRAETKVETNERKVAEREIGGYTAVSKPGDKKEKEKTR